MEYTLMFTDIIASSRNTLLFLGNGEIDVVYDVNDGWICYNGKDVEKHKDRLISKDGKYIFTPDTDMLMVTNIAEGYSCNTYFFYERCVPASLSSWRGVDKRYPMTKSARNIF